jgi:hypothetical protein
MLKWNKSVRLQAIPLKLFGVNAQDLRILTLTYSRKALALTAPVLRVMAD